MATAMRGGRPQWREGEPPPGGGFPPTTLPTARTSRHGARQEPRPQGRRPRSRPTRAPDADAGADAAARVPGDAWLPALLGEARALPAEAAVPSSPDPKDRAR